MKKAAKYILTIIIIALTAVFAIGCTNLTVTASITNDNLVTYTYNIAVEGIDEDDINYDELQLFFLDIKKYWEEEGLDCELLLEDDNINLSGVLFRQCATREEAFDTLYEFMTHKTSIFDDVTLNYTEDFYKTTYSLVSHLDLSGVIDEDVYNVYPQIVGDDVNEFIDSFNGSVKISLPADGDSTLGEESVVQNQVITNITFSEPAMISINGTIDNVHNKEMEQIVKEDESESKLTIIVSGSIALLSIIGLILLIIMKRKQDMQDDAEAK